MPSVDLEAIARKICTRAHLQFVNREAEGAFKQTFRVLDQAGLPLALKIYKTSHSSARDQREIKAMLRCKHPNIARLINVQTYDFAGDNFVGILEEFLPGGTLSSRGTLTISQGLAVGKQLIEAIAYLADLSLVHRDIKPDNIMFKADGSTPVITDFGVVRDLSDSSATPTWVPRGPGTPLYSAPEQLKNEKHLIDWRTDQFSLGVVLASAVFGDHPYKMQGASQAEIVNRVSARLPPAEWFGIRSAEYG